MNHFFSRDGENGHFLDRGCFRYKRSREFKGFSPHRCSVRRLGQPIIKDGIVLDNELNILTNKIGAIMDRDAARDVVDLVALAMNRSWSWPGILQNAQLKTQFGWDDFSYRLKTFPIAGINEILFIDTWKQPDWKWAINTIVSDLEIAGDNSLGVGKMESVYVKQVLTYLKLININLGIILNI